MYSLFKASFASEIAFSKSFPGLFAFAGSAKFLLISARSLTPVLYCATTAGIMVAKSSAEPVSIAPVAPRIVAGLAMSFVEPTLSFAASTSLCMSVLNVPAVFSVFAEIMPGIAV